MRKYEKYERLAAHIYSLLSKDCIVKHNDRILGHDSGIERQIDVSIRAKVGPHVILTIVECRDRQRMLDVKAVGEFKATVNDVRASKGVLICNRGFTKAARKLAKEYDIDLCSLHDAMSRDWRLATKIPIVARRVIPFVLLEPQKGITTADAETVMKNALVEQYPRFFRWFANLWATGVADARDGIFWFGDTSAILDAVFSHTRSHLSITKAGYLFDGRVLAGYVDELPGSKGIFNASSGEYLLTYSAAEMLALTEAGCREINFDESRYSCSLLVTIVGEPLFAFAKMPIDPVDLETFFGRAEDQG